MSFNECNLINDELKTKLQEKGVSKFQDLFLTDIQQLSKDINEPVKVSSIVTNV